MLCNRGVEETALHLFFTCHFSKRCWQKIGVTWDTSRQFSEMMEVAKSQFQHKFFMEMFIIATWCIWKQRNGLIFDNSPVSVNNT